MDYAPVSIADQAKAEEKMLIWRYYWHIEPQLSIEFIRREVAYGTR